MRIVGVERSVKKSAEQQGAQRAEPGEHTEAALAYPLGMSLVLGFDGGGTKTECVLMDATHAVRARGRGGPSNPMRVGFEGALESIREATQVTLRTANVAQSEIGAICAGLAGAAQPESAATMTDLLTREFPGKAVHVCTDLALTLEATGGGPAMVLIAGTGSAAIGRGCDGQIGRVGGHGFLLGDEGSAYDIGQRAAIAAMRAKDRGDRNSSLASLILRGLKLTDWPEIELRVYQGAPDEVFPRIFPVVAAAADQGDSEAGQLLNEASARLAQLVGDLAARLHLKEDKHLLVKTGGMVGRSAYFDRVMDEQLRLAVPHAEFGPLAMTEAEAAAKIALRLLSGASR
jgi:N-acetylglucosamine kinase-like BadF-type ATPase